MAKLKLLMPHKNLLRNQVSQFVHPKKEAERLDKAYPVALDVALIAVHTKYPRRDMVVLKKYEQTDTTGLAKLLYPTGIVQQFVFRADDMPVVPSRAHYYSGGQIYPVDEKGANVIEEWVDATTAFVKENVKRLQAYNALIDGAVYLEDLLPSWPEAATIVPATGGALLALGPEQLAAIAADRKERGVTE